MPVPTYKEPEPAENAGPTGSQSTTANREGQPDGQQATGAGVNTGAGVTREKTEAELEADRLYEERMEDEYAKREGGS
jgi:hypothetical protein